MPLSSNNRWVTTTTTWLLLWAASSATTRGAVVSESCAAGLATNSPWVSSADGAPSMTFGETVASFSVAKAYVSAGNEANEYYAAYAQACASLLGHTICEVSTTVRFADGLTADEVGKPVCFPPSCAKTDVEVVDAAPLLCTEDKGCAVQVRMVTCPDDRVVNGTTCADDVADLADNNPGLAKSRKNLQQEMDARCVGVLHGEVDAWCPLLLSGDGISSAAKAVDASPHNTVRDFTRLQGKNYDAMANRCQALNGTLCQVDTTVERELSDTISYEIGKPLCFPNTCDADPASGDVFDMDPYPVLCDSAEAEAGDCRVSERTVTCPDTKPTLDTLEDCMTSYVNLMQDFELKTKAKDIEKRLNRDCLESVLGEKEKSCRMVYPRVREEQFVYTGEKSTTTTYDEFLTDCHAARGEACSFSATLEYDTRSASSFVEGYHVVTDFPFCKPEDDCDSESRRNLAFHLLFGERHTQECGANGDQCDLRIGDAECVAASLSPSDTASEAPTMSPVATVVTDAPVQSPVVDEPSGGGSKSPTMDGIETDFSETNGGMTTNDKDLNSSTENNNTQSLTSSSPPFMNVGWFSSQLTLLAFGVWAIAY